MQWSISTWDCYIHIFLFVLNTQIIKTQTARIPDLSTFVEANHPYDVPEVISMNVSHIFCRVLSVCQLFSPVLYHCCSCSFLHSCFERLCKLFLLSFVFYSKCATIFTALSLSNYDKLKVQIPIPTSVFLHQYLES